MSEEWGPWIEHDGSGCPCLGAYVQTVRAHKFGRFGPGGSVVPLGNGTALVEGWIREPANWDWSMFGKTLPNGTVATKVLSYRIRKPKGLTILEGLLTNLPEEVDA